MYNVTGRKHARCDFAGKREAGFKAPGGPSAVPAGRERAAAGSGQSERSYDNVTTPLRRTHGVVVLFDLHLADLAFDTDVFLYT